MPDYSGLVRVMKQAGSDATEAKNPVKVCFGKVTSTSPLKILVEQRITLGAAQLVLTRNVTEDANNALQDNDEVVLLRMQGGQKYIVIDKVV